MYDVRAKASGFSKCMPRHFPCQISFTLPSFYLFLFLIRRMVDDLLFTADLIGFNEFFIKFFDINLNLYIICSLIAIFNKNPN